MTFCSGKEIQRNSKFVMAILIKISPYSFLQFISLCYIANFLYLRFFRSFFSFGVPLDGNVSFVLTSLALVTFVTSFKFKDFKVCTYGQSNIRAFQKFILHYYCRVMELFTMQAQISQQSVNNVQSQPFPILSVKT